MVPTSRKQRKQLDGMKQIRQKRETESNIPEVLASTAQWTEQNPDEETN